MDVNCLVCGQPVREFRKFEIIVRAFDLKTDTEDRQRTIDLSQKDHRDWLTNFYFWALNNGHSVELINPKDDDKDAE